MQEALLRAEQVRTFVDLSVDALTRALRDRPVSLKGLGRHQARMFRYFGLRTDDLEQSAKARARRPR
ncbi:MAG TPA: hypothetical protein VMT11_01395 [Myxococcaceae bacterium]|nr:hypothetical protein [Myxococcaceae bacterium]